MTEGLLLTLLLLLRCIPAVAADETQQLGRLRQEHRRVQQALTRLAAQRDSVVVSADQLSARIDSLKAADSDRGELHDALRASLVLVQRMVGVDRQLETTQSRYDSLRERLRVAYDWEIGRLIQLIGRQPDQGLLAQLMVYQQEREELGTALAAKELQYGADMTIGVDDGPGEIRQKMELMEDIAARLQAEARRTSAQLGRCEEEYRLRTRARIFATQLKGLGPRLPQGSARRRSNSAWVMATGEAVAGSERTSVPARAEASAGDYGLGSANGWTVTPVRGALPGALRGPHEGEVQALPVAAGADVALEIHKLRAHQQEIRELEAVARERAASFRVYLEKMLEEGE